MFACEYCPKSYSYQKNLDNHIINKHKDKLEEQQETITIEDKINELEEKINSIKNYDNEIENIKNTINELKLLLDTYNEINDIKSFIKKQDFINKSNNYSINNIYNYLGSTIVIGLTLFTTVGYIILNKDI